MEKVATIWQNGEGVLCHILHVPTGGGDICNRSSPCYELVWKCARLPAGNFHVMQTLPGLVLLTKFTLRYHMLRKQFDESVMRSPAITETGLM